MNKVVLSGHCVRGPELRYTTANMAVTEFILTVEQPFYSIYPIIFPRRREKIIQKILHLHIECRIIYF